MRTLVLLASVICLGGIWSARAEPGTKTPDMHRILAVSPAPFLSDYALFTDARASIPSQGVIPYDLSAPLFSDYASKSRLVFVPPDSKARVNGDGVVDFPVGSVLIKTFAFPADLRAPDSAVKRIETRLLIHKASGWMASTYIWNETGDAARLLEVGAQIPMSLIDLKGGEHTFIYSVPNRNQCKECHNLDGALTPIGPKPRNLDHNVRTSAGLENQIDLWVRSGALHAPPARSEPSPFADLAQASLDIRARAYLDANCAHCHNPAGSANNSGLDLSFGQTSPDRFGVAKRPVAAGRASGGFQFDIDPGHPEDSILIHRMESTDPGVMMPKLGRALVDEAGVELVRDWIVAMRPGPTQSTTQLKQAHEIGETP